MVFLLLSAFFNTTSTLAQETETEGELHYPIKEEYSYPFSTSGYQSPLWFGPPSNVEQKIVYNPETNSYEFSETIGQINYRPPSEMDFNEYKEYDALKTQNDYWREKSREDMGAGPSFLKSFRLGNKEIFKVFGTDAISITPQGSAELIFGYSITKNDNPQIPVRNQRNGSFIFKEKIMMNVTGTVGDKLELGLNYNTEATFDFENKTKLEYSGEEDEIIKKIEAGDVSLTLPGTLISGSQGLFGIKTELQFGRLTVQGLISHQRTESKTINVENGAQQTEFEIDAVDYDENRHFFLSHFFRDNYNKWLENLPLIESQVQITQIEVWVVNKQNDFTESRNVVAFMDLGEGYNSDGEPNFYAEDILYSRGYNQPADNRLNNLYSSIASSPGIRTQSTVKSTISSKFDPSRFIDGRDYINLESARPLSESEYTLNDELGYISLNSALRNDEILAVAYVYTYKGKTYSVGEISNTIDAPKSLIVKLLKGTTQTPAYNTFDLMMKNVYSLNAYQVSSEGFVLEVMYRNDKTGTPVNYFNEKEGPISDSANRKLLLRVMDLDNLDSRNEPTPDGIFDFVEGVTIYSRNGRVFFPTLEPFGSDLRRKIVGDESQLSPSELAGRNSTADEYVFEELYDSTQTKAEQVSEKNKFFLQGYYQSSSSSEIQLNAMNIPRGSVTVSAGGIQLQENVDYTVDYTLGRVKILNQGLLESGTPIKINLESSSLFNLQSKTLVGTHLDYSFSENFNVGATLMHLSERPLTEKVNMGDEPISNTIFGMNTSYRTESQFLTTLIDKIPLIETKEPSSIALDAEFAHLIPGQSNATNGIAYIDDFEGAETNIDLRTFISWTLASPPRDESGTFTNSYLQESEICGYNRAKLAWYIIDPIFYTSSRPDGPDPATNHWYRQVKETEIFPYKESENPGFETPISVFNLNYYPNERGPYNYNPAAVDGELNNLEDQWAGIMREIVTSDFESSNIEYIEFWLMDPFAEDDNKTFGGDLYFHLGEISEDILPDSRKSFENGYPTDATVVDVDTTIWGRVPEGQSLVNSFDTDEDTRQYQDIGLDGLSSSLPVGEPDEQSFFKDFVDATNETEDPSADNFVYYLDESVDGQDILQRYKNYNGLEGNSAASKGEYSSASKGTPDVEDINGDNTLNTTETYYQYKVSLRYEDLQQVGSNYIVDKMTTTGDGYDKSVTWYQFRIPIDDPESIVGEISDFKSIRFIRMMLNGFSKEVVLRFATLDLVRGEWRRYNYDLAEAGPVVTGQQEPANFEVSAVNIEENASKSPIPYVLPPGITRVTDPSQPQIRQLNEQSLLLKVTDLEDADSRAVFKNTDLDLRQYKDLKMFIHAEALPGEDTELEDYEMVAFIRMGSDYKNNYYEFEVPLKKTVHGTSTAADNVWPEPNWIDLSLDDFVSLKKERNELVKENPFYYSTTSVYSKDVTKLDTSGAELTTVKNRIKVKGNPNLSNIRQIMLGIKNPGDASCQVDNDGLPKSVEVWFNELRLEDFNNKGGWAANGQVQAKLADLGVLNVAGSRSTPGFGSIDESVDERQMEEINQYDISTNLELGKIFPEKAKVSVPLYVGVSKTIVNPEYFPNDPDVKLKDVLAEADSKEERDSLKHISQDYTARKSINLTNVRWNKNLEKLKIVSPGNLTASIGYTETRIRSYSLEYNNTWKYGGSLNYVYNSRPKAIQPLSKVKALRKPTYRILRDFNFYPLPSRVTFGTSLTRNYQEMKVRNVFTTTDGEDPIEIEPTVSKDFSWNRTYTLKWDLTRSLKFDYSANNLARIGEPEGAYDWFKDDNQEWKDSVWSSIRTGGRNMNFNQQFNTSYTLPINKIPLFNWTTINASYGATLSWVRGEKVLDETRELGNTLKNSNTTKLTGNFNMRNLYNKVGYFKRLDQKYSGRKKSENVRTKTVEYTKRTFFKKDETKSIYHKLGTEKIEEVKVYNRDNQPVDVSFTVENENKISVTAPEDISGATIVITGTVELGENPFVFIAENSIRFLLGLKNFSATWNRTSGTLLPGYLPETNYLGFNTTNFYSAPGWPFILGFQDPEFGRDADLRNWITDDETARYSKPVVMTMNETFNLRATFEPFKGLRLDLTAMRSYSEDVERYYDEYDRPYLGGSFSISIISLGTIFEPFGKSGGSWESAAFENLKINRPVISRRLHNKMVAEKSDVYGSSIAQIVYPISDANNNTTLYYDGYGPTAQDVLIPAFIAAYTGQDPERVTLERFPWTMMPNWRLTFDALSKVALIQKYIKNVTVTHSYKSTYSIGSFGTNTTYFDNISLLGDELEESNDRVRGLLRDNEGDFIPQLQISTVSIREELSPLVSFDMTWHNSLLTKLEMRRSRMVSLSLNNNQITETKNRDFIIGAGYRFKEVPITVNQRQIQSDLNVRFDLSVRDNITILRSLTELEEDSYNEPTSGTKKFVISLTADYVLSEKFNIQFYFDRTVNTPYTSLSFPNSETNIGFSIRLSL